MDSRGFTYSLVQFQQQTARAATTVAVLNVVRLLSVLGHHAAAEALLKHSDSITKKGGRG